MAYEREVRIALIAVTKLLADYRPQLGRPYVSVDAASYVEAVGGELELMVKLPARPAFRLQRLGDLGQDSAVRTVGRRRKQVTA